MSVSIFSYLELDLPAEVANITAALNREKQLVNNGVTQILLWYFIDKI